MEKQNPYQKFIVLISTLGGLGFIPFLRGTLASLVGVGVFFLVKAPLLFFGFSLISLIISFLVCGKAEVIFSQKDARQIVIDDFTGMLLALAFIPSQAVWVFLSFFFFRMYDIFKVFPANLLEKKRGSLGVVGDDLIAGLYANITLQVLRFMVNRLV